MSRKDLLTHFAMGGNRNLVVPAFDRLRMSDGKPIPVNFEISRFAARHCKRSTRGKGGAFSLTMLERGIL